MIDHLLLVRFLLFHFFTIFSLTICFLKTHNDCCIVRLLAVVHFILLVEWNLLKSKLRFVLFLGCCFNFQENFEQFAWARENFRVLGHYISFLVFHKQRMCGEHKVNPFSTSVRWRKFQVSSGTGDDMHDSLTLTGCNLCSI